MYQRPLPPDSTASLGAAGTPAPEAATGAPASGAFIDTFLARTLANSVSMVAVAAGVLWVVGQQDQRHDAEINALRDEVALLRLERDRMQAVAGELSREVHDAGMESEIVRWQLAYTEERLRRSEAGVEARPGPGPGPGPGPAVSLQTQPVFAKAIFQPLDAPARVAAGLAPSGASTPPEAAAMLSPEPALGSAAPATGGGGRLSRAGELQLDDFEPDIPRLAEGYSQLDRDRAYGVWAGIVHDAIEGECGRKITETGQHRCGRDLRRALRPFAGAAVECIMSGNARPDYFSDLDPGRVPTHAVPLDRGVVLLCDGALPNL